MSQTEPTKDQPQQPAFHKPRAEEVGHNNPNRGCTDVPCVLLFIIAWAAMIYLCIVAFGAGDLDRLIYGVDYLGNVCSKGVPQNVTAEAAATWSNRTMLWYPITFNMNTRTFNIRSASRLGVCVSACPAPSHSFFDATTYVQVYGTTSLPDVPSAGWPVLFNSVERFHRCVPNLVTFNCSSAALSRAELGNTSTSGGSTTVAPTNATNPDCVLAIAGSKVEIDSELDLSNTFYRGFAELRENWWIVLSCFGIALVTCFLWLFVLRRLVKPVVILTMLILIVGLGAVGYFLFYQSNKIKEVNPEADSQKWYFYSAIGVWVLDFIVVCVILYAFKDIMIAADIIEEASRIPLAIPTMILVPPVTVLLALGMVFFTLFTAAFIYTSAKKSTFPVTLPTYSRTNSTVSTTNFAPENWQTPAHIFNIFMFLWTVGLIGAIDFMVLAFCSVFWYWSRPGDDKKPDHGVFSALCLTFRYHLGSLIFGSLIIAIIQVVRITIMIFEKRLEALSGKVDGVRFLIACAQCCLAYFERVVKFINKNAYIVQTITGESFITSAKHALSLLMHNMLSAAAVSIIGEYVMFFGKLFITVGVTAAAYGIMTRTSVGVSASSDSVAGMILVLIAVAVMAYVVSAIFINVFGVCIDTVLISYCYDIEQNNGADRPYFATDDLMKHLDRAKDRQQAAAKEREQKMQEKLVSSVSS